MKPKMSKRLLSLLMSLLMIVSIVPLNAVTFTASAADVNIMLDVPRLRQISKDGCNGCCYLCSLASVKAYAYGTYNNVTYHLGKDYDHSDPVHKLCVKKNGAKAYVYYEPFRKLGFSFKKNQTLNQSTLKKIYQNLAAGKPVVIYCKAGSTKCPHASVIIGYSGPTDSFSTDNFCVMEINKTVGLNKDWNSFKTNKYNQWKNGKVVSSCYVSLTKWKANRGSITLAYYSDKLSRNVKPGAASISLNAKDIAVNDVATVSWSKVENATDYDVYVDGAKVTSVKGTSYAIKAETAKAYEVMVIARNSAGSSPESNKLTFTAHDPCSVTFVNWDDTPLTAEPLQVPYGKDAVIPEIPVREGYTFVGWDKTTQNITQDCTIKAQYKINTYTVKFFDSKGNVLKTQKVDYLNAATAPENVNVPTGYAFLGWSTEEYLAVRSDLNVYGIYDWGNSQLPIVATNVTATRQQDGYYVYFDLTNTPDAINRGRAVVSLKTAEGKLIDTTESAAFSIPKDGAKTGMEVFVPSDEVATVAELIIVNSYSSGVPISEMKTVSISLAENMLTAWSTTEPDPDTVDGLQTKTEYRYRNKETTSSSSSTMDGWTADGYTESWSEYGEWSSWSKTQPTASESRQVDSKQVKVSDAYDEYLLFYFRYKMDGKWWYTYSKAQSDSYGGTKFLKWAKTTDIKATGNTYINKYDGYKKKSGYYNYSGETWFFEKNNSKDRRHTDAKYETQYCYRDRTKLYTYYYYRWKEWSEWSDVSVAANDNRQVETRTVYRWIDLSTVENNSGVERVVTGNIGAENAGKQLSLFVYKVDEASDFTNEFVGQHPVAADGSYSFTFKLREEPSVKTGDFTVAVGLEGANNTMVVDTIPAPKPTFEVKFFVDGRQVGETQTVEQGSAAVPPANPVKEGYTFCGWSADITNVQCNLEVEANFAVNRYTVVFVDWVAETVSVGEFEYGTILTYADAAEKEGYTFAGWEELEDMDAVVTQNMVLTAKYDKDVFEVVFYDFDGNEISRQNVEYGESAVFPEDPVELEMIFNGWESEEDLYVVTNDADAYADFVYEETCETPYADITTNEFTQAQTVTLACDTPNAVIYYTTDGSDPADGGEAGSTVRAYTAPITVAKNCALKFYAVCDGMNASDVVTETYVIRNGSVDSDLMVYEDLPDYVVANPSKFNVHTETGYQYKNTASTALLEEVYEYENEGWTADGFTFSDWSEWSMTEPEANGTEIEVESRQPDPVDTPFYQYTHWKYYDEATQTYICAAAEIEDVEGEWETVELPSYLPVHSFVGGTPTYSYNDELWFNQNIVVKGVVPDYLIYRYRTKVFSFHKWTAWTDEAPVADETRETVSAVVFRYTVPASHLVIVHDLPVFDGSADSQTDIYIVFENETVELDLEKYESDGLTLLGFYTDNEFTNEWDLDADIVTAKLDLYPKYEMITSTVTFVDENGQLIEEQQVDYNEDAAAPAYTPDDGFVFIRWDKSLASITEDVTITAIVKPTDEVIRVAFDKANVLLYADSTIRLNATVTPADAEDDTLVWTSSNEDAATVDENGVVTAVAAGTATIIATTVDGMTASCEITIKGQGEVESIALTANDIYLARYTTKQLEYSVEPRTADNTVTWTSTNPSIVSVDENGVITGNMAGIAIIIVTSNSGEKDYCLVRVVGVTAESTANINMDNGTITGLSAGLNSLENYISLTDDSCELTYDSIGTDSIVYLTREDEIIGAYTVVIFGDIDGNGWYDGSDAYFVKLVVNGMVSESALTDAQRMAADCNHDGVIDNTDVALLEQAGLLLTQVDQTLSSDELETDSVYLEYCGLIDQSIEITEPAADQPQEPAVEQGSASTVWQIIFDLFKRLVSFVTMLFSIIVIPK